MSTLDYLVGVLGFLAGIVMFLSSMCAFIVFAIAVAAVLNGETGQILLALVSGVSTVVLTVVGIRQVWNAGRFPHRRTFIREEEGVSRLNE